MPSPYLPGANTTAQNFSRTYPGSTIRPNVVVLHTTETGTWPGYSGGATAPTMTIFPAVKEQRLYVRQHFPFTMSARALRNTSGGVETNTLNCIQIELIGTCTVAYRDKYGYFFWPAAPDWALKQLAQMLKYINREYPAFPLKDAAPRGWRAYPSSYGNTNGQRMTMAEWSKAYGIVGHQHVPENDHGDPGNFPIDRLLGFCVDKPVTGDDPVAKPPTTVQKARALLREAVRDSHDDERRAQIKKGLRTLPKK